MNVIISDWALSKLETTYSFLCQQSEVSAIRIINEIFDSIELLANQPLMAPLELMLEKLPIAYRSLIIRRTYKVIYFIEDETIVVTDIWDCRQSPEKLKRDVISRT